MKRIGLYGGSFDPPHLGHLALAHIALEHLRLDELRWLPAGTPYQKRCMPAPAADRQAMVEAAIAGEPRFVIDTRELQRIGPSYTIDTLRELQRDAAPAQWFLVIGQDQYAGFHTWHGWEELLSRVTIAVANRPDASPLADPQVRAVAHEAVQLPMMDVSSTDIRERLRHAMPIDDLVPPSVARYIDQHHLYRVNNGS